MVTNQKWNRHSFRKRDTSFENQDEGEKLFLRQARPIDVQNDNPKHHDQKFDDEAQ